MDTSRTKTFLGKQKAFTFFADKVFVRNADVGIDDLGVPAESTIFTCFVRNRMFHCWNISDDIYSGRIGRHDDH